MNEESDDEEYGGGDHSTFGVPDEYVLNDLGSRLVHDLGVHWHQQYL